MWYFFFYKKDQYNYSVSTCPKDKFLFYSNEEIQHKECVQGYPDTLPYLIDTYECVNISNCTFVKGTKCLTTSNACLYHNSKLCVQFSKVISLIKIQMIILVINNAVLLIEIMNVSAQYWRKKI